MQTETRKQTLADELRATGTELGRRAADVLEEKDALLAEARACLMCVEKGTALPKGASVHAVLAALRAGEGS